MTAKSQDAATRVATALAALRSHIANLVSGGELDKANLAATNAEKALEEVVSSIEKFVEEILPPPPVKNG